MTNGKGEKWRMINQMEERKLRRRRGRRKRKISNNFVTLADNDVSKRAKLLSFKKWGKNYFEFWDWIYYTIISHPLWMICTICPK